MLSKTQVLLTAGEKESCKSTGQLAYVFMQGLKGPRHWTVQLAHVQARPPGTLGMHSLDDTCAGKACCSGHMLCWQGLQKHLASHSLGNVEPVLLYANEGLVKDHPACRQVHAHGHGGGAAEHAHGAAVVGGLHQLTLLGGQACESSGIHACHVRQPCLLCVDLCAGKVRVSGKKLAQAPGRNGRLQRVLQSTSFHLTHHCHM